jgi:putative ABC transport system permease protein
MPNIGEWSRRAWYLLNRSRIDAALRREMEDHRAMMADPARFGNALRLREESHDVWGWGWLDHLVRDLRYAARMLRRTPGFTAVSVISLALGFMLTASTVAVLNAYVLRSLPYDHADRLYHVMYAPPGPWEPGGMEALDWRAVNDVVEFPITASGATFYLSDGGHTQSIRGLRAGLGLIEGLGIRAAAGRILGASDFAATSEHVALIGHALWRDRYGSDPSIVGRHIRTEPEGGGPAESFQIVGVLPPEFYFGRDSQARVDLLVPVLSARRTYMVRLRDGVPREYAEQRITQAARSVATGLTPAWSGVRLESAHWRYVGQLQPILVGITVAAGLVLVVVCANLAVLMVLRTMRRQKEIAVRTALGAERRHLARMLVAEGVLLCSTGLGLGILLTRWLLGVLAPIIETELGRPAPHGTSAIAVDGTVLLIVGSLGVLIALALPLLPLLTPWQLRLADDLRRAGNTSTDGRSVRHLRSSLIAFEVAGTLILFIGCGLLLRSAAAMLQTDLGFDADRLVRARIVLRASDYSGPSGFFRFYGQFTDRLAAVTNAPVVFSNWPPFVDLPTQWIEADDRTGQSVKGGAMQIGAGYFSTLGIPLRAGRDFTRADGETALAVAVVSETLARRLWPGDSALGRQVRASVQTEGGSTPGPWRTVVGVAADVRQEYPDPNVADFYAPITPASVGRFGSFYVRGDRPLASIFGEARAVAAGLDPHAVVDLPRTVVSENRQLAGTTFLTTMLTGFAAIAGFLAMLGIYGVTAYGVQQRQREIAIRMALGAPGGCVVRLFVKEGAVVLATGVAAGLIGAAAVVRLLEHQLFAVEPFDPVTLVSTCFLVTVAGVSAIWWPAKRASRANPVLSLKEG